MTEQEAWQWRDAALLLECTRCAILERLRTGEAADLVAAEFAVPIEFVEHLQQWQLFGDTPQMPRTKSAEPQKKG